MTEYEQGKARLVEHVKGLLTPFNMTEKRKQALDLADRLDAIIEELDGSSPLWFDLECEHDKPPERGVGFDGLPFESPYYGCSFKGTLCYMRDIVASARRVAESYPGSRKRNALPAAAMGLVSLWYAHGRPRPSLYVAGPAVTELATICAAAGIEIHDGTAPVPKGRKRVRIQGAVTADRLRGELTNALNHFDPTSQPTWVHHVLTGRWEW